RDFRNKPAAGKQPAMILAQLEPDADRLGRIMLEQHGHAADAADRKRLHTGWHSPRRCRRHQSWRAAQKRTQYWIRMTVRALKFPVAGKNRESPAGLSRGSHDALPLAAKLQG